MVRYPHLATIITSVTAKDANGDVTSMLTELSVKGRFEPSPKNALDYSGKFYCKKLNFEPFLLEGQTLKFNGVTFGIAQSFNYQTHCEIWLK